jgi:hypothetical protein
MNLVETRNFASLQVLPFLCEAAPNLAHAGGLCMCSREFTRRVIKRSLIKNWYLYLYQGFCQTVLLLTFFMDRVHISCLC